MMEITRCTAADVETWARLRHALWPEAALATLRLEAEGALRDAPARTVAFLARTASGDVAGFAEATLRRDYVNGCETSPVAFLEGIYVEPPHRRSGIASALVTAVTTWAKEQGCRELASDALLSNSASHQMHNALGFIETERVVYFKKML
jgi:aminoglycoside 6'-N-acetyltransferase I